MSANYIQVPFPHMVLNSHDVPEPDYEMYNGWKVDASIPVSHMTDWIRVIALGAPGGKLKTLIFNSHGSPGRIHIGQGIDSKDLHHFQFLKKDDKATLVDEIWIIACQVAGKVENVSGGISGEAFCKELAQTSLSKVTAAIRNQPASGPISIPPWHVEEWTGEVFTYHPNGTRVKIH